MRRAAALVVAVFLCAIGCSTPKDDDDAWLGSISRIDSPAATGSRYPQLSRDANGAIVLSWMQPLGAGYELRFASWQGGGWSASRAVSSGTDWVVNWADFPSVVPATDGKYVAHWLRKRPDNVYSYDVQLAVSGDSGASWSAPVTPHDDGTPTEHGFVSMLRDRGHWLVVWLDGRATAGHAGADAADGAHGPSDAHGAVSDQEQVGAMTLRAAHVGTAGGISDPQLLDERVCDCCQTAAAMTRGGPIVAYRDRNEAEVRDIFVVRLTQTGWTEPRKIHADDWRIDACPVNGPAIDALDDFVAVAWFTAADQPRVRLAFSSDGGATFGSPIEVAAGRVAGRVDVAVLDARYAAVSWVDAAPTPRLLVQRFDRHGAAGDAVVVTGTGIDRSSGFPRMAHSAGSLVFAWTEPGDAPHVRTAGARVR